MTTQHRNHDNHRTKVYLELSNVIQMENVAGYIAELKENGFVVTSKWHTGVPHTLRSELNAILRSDMLIVFVNTLEPRTWVKVGFAASAGIRTIAVGKTVHDVNSFFVLACDTWADLTRNRFLKLGTGMTKNVPDWIEL